MTRRRSSQVATSLAASAFFIVAHAQEPAPTGFASEWALSGSLTTKVERYRDSGPDGTSPFRDQGLFEYAEVDLNAQRRFSPYEQLRGQFFGVFAKNPYRSSFEYFVPERANLTWEKGDTLVPMRVQAGDIFALITPRSIQRSLKGLQVEFQPKLATGKWRHSVQFFGGIATPNYRHLQLSDERNAGASWLMAHPTKGSVSIGLSGAQHAAGVNAIATERNNSVLSAAVERPVQFASERLDLFGEVSAFFGDDAAGTQRDESDLAVVLDARGKSGRFPLGYGLRLEHFGPEYRPTGAAVSPARRNLEARADWRFDNAWTARARSQWSTDALRSSNERRTFSNGLNLSGPLDFLARKLTATADYRFVSTRDKRRTSDTLSHVASLSLSGPIDRRTSGQATYRWRAQHAEVTANAFTHELSLSLNHQRTYEGWQLGLTPSARLRTGENGAGDGHEAGLGLGLDATKGPWAASANYQFSRQHRDRVAGADTWNHTFVSRASYSRDQHQFGLEFDYSANLRDNTASNKPLRAALTYSFQFDKPIGRGLFEAATPPATFATAPVPLDVSRGALDITQIPPGASLTETLERLAARGIVNGEALGARRVVYRSPAFDSVDLPQRLVVEHDGSRPPGRGHLRRSRPRGRRARS